jgi:hypothetical protein
MLLIALVSPFLFGAADASSGINWAASVNIARIEAKRTGRPMLAVYTPNGRGYWLLGMLNEARVREACHPYLLVGVESPKEFRRLVPDAEPPPFAQIVIVGRDGKIAKRLSGMVRPTDLRDCFQQVYGYLGLNPAPATADDQARQATRLAMRGDLKAAEALLAGSARGARADLRADAYGAIGDELRARGETDKAMSPLETAVSLSESGLQAARWTVRLAMNRARIGDRAMAMKELLDCAQRPDLSAEEQNGIREFAMRVGEMRGAPRQGWRG